MTVHGEDCFIPYDGIPNKSRLECRRKQRNCTKRFVHSTIVLHCRNAHSSDVIAVSHESWIHFNLKYGDGRVTCGGYIIDIMALKWNCGVGWMNLEMATAHPRPQFPVHEQLFMVLKYKEGFKGSFRIRGCPVWLTFEQVCQQRQQ